jgi:hypothetical protein
MRPNHPRQMSASCSGDDRRLENLVSGGCDECLY